jgi:hypothetical protein
MLIMVRKRERFWDISVTTFFLGYSIDWDMVKFSNPFKGGHAGLRIYVRVSYSEKIQFATDGCNSESPTLEFGSTHLEFRYDLSTRSLQICPFPNSDR